jgi:hypothetical protein
MKLVIAGGRDFLDGWKFHTLLDRLCKKYHVTEIVSGCQRGADTCGEIYAKSKGLKIKPFPPNWAKFGLAAGPKRNAQMVAYTDYVFLFPGGSGTDNMREAAKKAGKKIIYDFAEREGSTWKK